jgi:hypothetical protein
MLMESKKVLVSKLVTTILKNAGNTIAVMVMVSVKMNPLMVTAIGDKLKTMKWKAMGQN